MHDLEAFRMGVGESVHCPTGRKDVMATCGGYAAGSAKGPTGRGGPADRRVRTGERSDMTRFTRGVVQRIPLLFIRISLPLGGLGSGLSEAHQDPCHRLHSCPSDHNSYV